MQREFSETNPELMDLPNQNENALRSDLEHLARLNRTFGGRKAVETIFHKLADTTRRLVLIDLASGYGDHGRNLIRRAQARQSEITVMAVDMQFQTLQIARRATPPGERMFFVQADARQLPFRNQGADLVFCSLALHHFAEKDALTVLREMARVGRHGTACIDLVRSRLAAFCIWLLTTFIIRDPMVRHDARLSVRRAFTDVEMKSLAHQAGWPNLKQIKFFWFQQAVLARTEENAAKASFHEFRHSGGMTESSPAIHRRVCRREAARPGGTLDQPHLPEFQPSLRDGQLHLSGRPGDKSPGYFQMSLRDFNLLPGSFSQRPLLT